MRCTAIAFVLQLQLCMRLEDTIRSPSLASMQYTNCVNHLPLQCWKICNSKAKELATTVPRETGCQSFCNHAYTSVLRKQEDSAMTDAQQTSKPCQASSRRAARGTRGVGGPPSGQATPCPGRQLAACRLHTAALIKAEEEEEGCASAWAGSIRPPCTACTTHKCGHT